MRDTQTIIPYWFLMRAAGHLTREGHVYNGTCPKCHAREILMLAAMHIGYTEAEAIERPAHHAFQITKEKQ